MSNRASLAAVCLRLGQAIRVLIAVVAGLGASSTALAASADASSTTYNIDIPAEKLGDALQAFAIASHHKLLYSSKLVRGLNCSGLKGQYTTEAAIKKLLSGTHLIYRITAEGLIVIRAAATPGPASDDMNGERQSPAQSYADGTLDAPGSPAQPPTPPGGVKSDSAVHTPQSPTLEEVIVTAQKREQRLIDVPMPVTAISANTLIEDNQVRLQDYYASIPGLNFSTNLNGAPILSIRGLNTGFGNPTTSVTIDGVPFGSSSGYGGFVASLPDVDPSDLERIEVLRGPQGTLYGASSLGGLINYVTVEPSTHELSGRVETDLSSIQNADDPAYAVRAAVNVPVSDAVALRISGFGRWIPGYINNVLTGERGTNRADAEGAYSSVLIRPANDWSLRLSALYQNSEGYGSNYADPALGDLKQSDIPGTGTYHSELQAYSAILKAKLGVAELTSLSGYNVNSIHDVLDDTNDFGSFTQAVFGVSSALDRDRQTTNKFTQELRLSMPLGDQVDWLLGLFYTHEKALANQQWWAASGTTGAILPDGNFLDGSWPTTYTDYAAFTNVTVRFSDRFDVQLGGRESENRQTYSEIDGGGYTTVFGLPGAPAPLVTPEVDTKDSSFTYLVAPRFRVSEGVMVYARLATGYRPGGPNPTCSAFSLPCHFDPDRTQDYEIGVKADVLDHRLDVDSSVFYIDWKHIQVETFPPCNCASLFVNAGGAKSEGIEFSAQGRPISTLTLSGWVDFTDAELTESFPANSAAVGVTGDRLPFSSKFSANFSAEQDFPVSRGTLFIGGQVSYVGNRLGYFEYLPQRSYYPAYTETSVRGGVLFGNWRITAFANNVTDKRGVLGGNLPIPYGGLGYEYIQPRTIGVSVARTF